MSGVAEAFNVSPVPTLRTGSDADTQEYEEVLNTHAVRGAAVSGASRALERIADYYLEMADNIFPILEVDAGREIDLIMTSGVDIRFDDSSNNSAGESE